MDEISGSEPEVPGPPREPRGSRRGPEDRECRRQARPEQRVARRVVAVSALSLAALTAASAVGLVAIYNRLDHNIKTVDIGGRLPGSASSSADGSPLNLLLIGSDSRDGANAQYGADSGARSDTTMLVHVAADRKSATVASIPRDTMVQIPSCDVPGGGLSDPQFGMFNSAFAIGGAACTTQTVQALTGIPIDHVLVVDFTGFKTIVDAVGGVPVHLDQAVDDPDSHLDLPAGTSIVTGEQALAFVRVRHGIGNGSDIGRMARQQQFLQATLDKLTSDGVLDDPAKLYKVLDAATKSLTTDPGLGSLSALSGLASDLKQVPRSDIAYLTVPWEWYPPDPNRVEFAPAADDLFTALREDEPVPASVTSPSASPTSDVSPTPDASATR